MAIDLTERAQALSTREQQVLYAAEPFPMPPAVGVTGVGVTQTLPFFATGGPTVWPQLRGGHIESVCAMLTAPCTSGTLTINVLVDGVASLLCTITSAQGSAHAEQLKTPIRFYESSTLSVQTITDGTYADSAASVYVVVGVRHLLPGQPLP